MLALLNSWLAARAKIDEGLRDERIARYTVLWKATGLLPRWPRATDVTYERLLAFSGELRDWYFQDGGLYLSARARKRYGDLQDEIGAVLDSAQTGTLSVADYARVRNLCSAVRTELTCDLHSRRRAMLFS